MSHRQQGFRPPRGGKIPPPPQMGGMPEQPPASPFTQTNVQAGEGRMMIRMIIVQVIQGQVMNRKNLTPFKKVMILFIIFLGLLSYDIQQFFQNRTKNVYDLLNIPKDASNDIINNACNNLTAQLSADYEFEKTISPIFTGVDQVEDIRHMLTTEVLRDIYEKTGHFTTIQEYKERAGQIPLSMRYLQAIGGAMNFAMFFILIFFMVDKHQIFAKQVSLSSLLMFIYIAVYMKFPKDGDKENEIAQLVNQIPYFKTLTINEVGMLLILLFSNLFHLILSISKLIDVHPLEDMKKKYKKIQSKTFKSQFLCEAIHTKQLERLPKDPVSFAAPIEEVLPQNELIEAAASPALPELTPEQKEKKEFFEVYERVARARQTGFLAEYKNVNDKKKEALAKEGKLKKCFRLLGKVVMALIILTIVYSALRPKIYNYMGWELQTNTTVQADQQPNYPPPPPYPGQRRPTPEEIQRHEQEQMNHITEKTDDYVYKEKAEDYADEPNVFSDNTEIDPRDDL